jgi:hypothetical protein
METRRKSSQKLRAFVSPWFALLDHLQPLSAPYWHDQMTTMLAKINLRLFAMGMIQSNISILRYP